MNDVGAMDVVSDKLFAARPFRIPTILDCHAREALATAARTNFRAAASKICCAIVEATSSTSQPSFRVLRSGFRAMTSLPEPEPTVGRLDRTSRRLDGICVSWS